ncbi:proteasome maturation factor UMP1 [Lecanosticta acicola]|uniref:Proteasome maturation factor UMP1 n=1 Tax=Lecanosticta acicola TaxID=111012 RepID=A0AAI9E957_9PEZI|nr:proteasome maturation factor UMP1 [Lecanosticta acicola]
MSLRIVPSASNPTTTHANIGAPSAPGVHDTLRANLNLTTPAPKTTTSSSSSTSIASAHPLESRLANWRSQQEALKMELLRRQFGIAEPVKRQMELAIVRAGEWQPAALGGRGTAGLHADILAGTDCEFGWEEVFVGEEMRAEPVDFHTEMEGRFRMNTW